ncbi:hypothetical protein Trydic_g7887 [Trypoxylus dichotomus]
MGGVFGCIDDVTNEQRTQYDMSIVKKRNLPIIWLVGPPGSGRTTQANILSENLGYDAISIASLIRNEANFQTERGQTIKEVLEDKTKRIPDTMIVDIIKEEILKRVNEAKGFILNGFPRTSKQALLFVKEVKDVDAVIYLYSETYKMVSRVQEKKGDIDEEVVKNEIFKYVNEVKEGTAKFSAKVEKVYTDAAPEEVFNKIESALNLRLKHYKRTVM